MVGAMGRPITLTSGKGRPKKNWGEQIKDLADECLWSYHCTVVADVLVPNQLKCFL